MKNPKVTVLMPVYNGERYIRAAIDSILNQTFTDYELLIINDGSTDNSMNLVGTYKNERIRVLHNEKNLGLVASRNRGVEASRGKYILFMDCDDISFPDRLRRQVGFMDSHPDIGVSGAAIRLIDSAGKELSSDIRFPTNPDVFNWSLFFYQPLANPTAIIRKKVLTSVEGKVFRASSGCEDYDLWCRLSHVTKMTNLPDVLLYLRKHESNITTVLRQDHLTTGASICRRHVTEELKRDVSFEQIQCLWLMECKNADDAAGCCRLIIELYHTYMRRHLDSSAGRLIKKDAAKRLWGIALPFRNDPRLFRNILLAIYFNPLFLLKEIGHKLIMVGSSIFSFQKRA